MQLTYEGLCSQTFYRTATLPLLRSYFSCLFRALYWTHSFDIIHRDVKPANFLYDRERKTGVLCDFGLAQRIGDEEWYEWNGECLHSMPSRSTGGMLEKVKVLNRVSNLAPGVAPGLLSGLHGVRMSRPVSPYDQMKQIEEDWSLMSRTKQTKMLKPWMMSSHGGVKEEMRIRSRERASWYKNWSPASIGSGAGGGTGSKRERAGYLMEDRRFAVLQSSPVFFV